MYLAIAYSYSVSHVRACCFCSIAIYGIYLFYSYTHENKNETKKNENKKPKLFFRSLSQSLFQPSENLFIIYEGIHAQRDERGAQIRETRQPQ